MQPLRNRVLIKPFLSEEKTTTGLFIPENARERSNKATVVSVGAGTAKRPMYFRPGMIVHNIKDAGMEVQKDGELHFLVTDADLIAAE